MAGYTEYDTVKIKLRLPDDTMFEEILLLMQEVDDMINNRIRTRLGEFDSNGDPVVLPLTPLTVPPIDNELKSIAADLIEGKLRLKDSEKPVLWDSAIKRLENYLDRRFGWARDNGFTITRMITITPTNGLAGATITVSGSGFRNNDKLKFFFGNEEVTALTTPTPVFTTSVGAFSGVTFVVPATFTQESVEKVKVLDTKNGQTARFTVTV